MNNPFDPVGKTFTLEGTISLEKHHEEVGENSGGHCGCVVTSNVLMFDGNAVGALGAIVASRIPIADIKRVPVRIHVERLDIP